jgi:hypothetical protein
MESAIHLPINSIPAKPPTLPCRRGRFLHTLPIGSLLDPTCTTSVCTSRRRTLPGCLLVPCLDSSSKVGSSWNRLITRKSISGLSGPGYCCGESGRSRRNRCHFTPSSPAASPPVASVSGLHQVPVDNLDEVPITGKLLVRSSRVRGSQRSSDHESSILENPSWLDLCGIANDQIIASRNRDHRYLEGIEVGENNGDVQSTALRLGA